ncbi:MAG TPA: carbohydrate ABC transporter permease [Dictyoglomaceae bacterium]|nr:carbohydrate ABC transporter permease [Dictyoglomaceae bacterium]
MKKAMSMSKYLVLIILAIACLFPFLYSLYISLQYPEDYGKLVGFNRLSLTNYKKILELVPIGRWYLNTILITCVVTFSNLLFSSMAGYALAHSISRVKNIIFMLILGVMILPVQAYLIPLYFNIVHWGLQNTYWSLILPIAIYPFCVFLMRQYFLTLPKELEDAAKIDGLGPLGVFFRIALPLSKPALSTQAILSFTWTWNGFVIPVTMINNSNYYTLTVGLNTLKDFYFNWPTIDMAGVIYTILPIIIVFIFLQEHITQAFATTGLGHI